jgi:hypothetical protein
MDQEGMTDTLTNTGAGVALTSYWWLPSLHALSDTAALLLPILGAAWLLVQIVTRLYATFKK